MMKEEKMQMLANFLFPPKGNKKLRIRNQIAVDKEK